MVATDANKNLQVANVKPRRKSSLLMGTKSYFNAEMKVLNAKRALGPESGGITSEAYNQGVAAASARLKAGVKQKTLKQKADTLVSDDPRTQQLLNTQTDQNYIMSNMIEFANLNKRPEPTDLDNLITLSNYSGNLRNKLTLSRKMAPLFTASPLELSSLVPHFRLFKKNNSGTIQEFKFADRYNFQYRTGQGDILSHQTSRGAGVGLKDFSWETTGTNPFTASRTLQASMNLHFQSVTDLANQARGLQEGPRWCDLIIQRVDKRARRHVCPTDIPELKRFLAGDFGPDEIKKFQRNPPEFKVAMEGYSIMAEVGWAVGDKNLLSTTFSEAVEESRILLDLGLQHYKFQFREDGTIDLNILFIASIEGVSGGYGANIFSLDSSGASSALLKEIEQKQDDISQLNSSITSKSGLFACMKESVMEDQQYEAQTEEQVAATDQAIQGKEDVIKKNIETMLEGLEVLRRQYKISMYSKFVQHLIEQERLSFIDVPIDDYALGVFSAKPADFTDYSSTAALPAEGSTEWENVEQEGPTEDHTADLLNTDASDGGTNQQQVDMAAFSEGVEAQIKACVALKEGYRRIYFFYTGDLVNFYAGALPGADARGINRYEVILGDLSFINYGKLGKALGMGGRRMRPAEAEAAQSGDDAPPPEDVEELVNTEGSIYRVKKNLADVPVSLDGYNQWFVKEIINKGRDKGVYSFKQFMESFCSKLMVGSLQTVGNQYIGSGIQKLLQERSVVRGDLVFGANPYLKRGARLTGEVIKPNGQSNLYCRAALPVISNQSSLDDSSDVEINTDNELRQFFCLSVSRLPPQNTVVDEDANAADGIFHLKIGVNKGIVKNIDFQRDSSTATRDMNMMHAYNTDLGYSMGIAKEPYQASVKLFGAGFFQPGQYVYLNPTNIGLGALQARYSLAREIGIGGFYLITHCAHSVREGAIDTTLTCKFEYYGELEAPDADDDVVLWEEGYEGGGITDDEFEMQEAQASLEGTAMGSAAPYNHENAADPSDEPSTRHVITAEEQAAAQEAAHAEARAQVEAELAGANTDDEVFDISEETFYNQSEESTSLGAADGRVQENEVGPGEHDPGDMPY